MGFVLICSARSGLFSSGLLSAQGFWIYCCRAAFSFVYADAAKPLQSGGVLAQLLGGFQGGGGRSSRSLTEFPPDDMRALDGLERLLRQAGVLNK